MQPDGADGQTAMGAVRHHLTCRCGYKVTYSSQHYPRLMANAVLQKLITQGPRKPDPETVG